MSLEELLEKRKTLEEDTQKLVENLDEFFNSIFDLALSFYTATTFGLLYTYHTTSLSDQKQTHFLLVAANSLGLFAFLWPKSLRATFTKKLEAGDRKYLIFPWLSILGIMAFASFVMIAVTQDWESFQILVLVLAMLAVLVPAGLMEWDLKRRIGEKQSLDASIDALMAANREESALS